MSQMSEVQLAAGLASKSAYDEELRTRIYLYRCMVHFNICARGWTFVLTVSDIDGMVPRFRIVANRYIYLFHIYRIRETRDFGVSQMYWYSFPEVRRTSYRSRAIRGEHFLGRVEREGS